MVWNKGEIVNIKELNTKLTHTFVEIKDEFDDHLEAVNENTDEIHLLNSFLQELDEKIDKLGTRVDSVCIALKSLGLAPTNIELDTSEQKIFLALYIEQGFSTILSLARKANVSEFFVEEKLQSIADKGVPLVRDWKDECCLVRLEDLFRIQQARQEIVKIEPSIKQQMNNKALVSFFSE